MVDAVKASLPVGGDRLVASFGSVVNVVAYTTVEGRPGLATGGSDGTVRRWDATTGAPIGEPLTGHTSSVSAAAAYTTVEGRPALATASTDGTMRRWDATTGAPIGKPLTGHSGQVWAVVAYTTTERRPALATAGAHRIVRRWDAITGAPIGEPLTGHTSLVRAVAAYTTVEGRPALATAGDDGTVRRWDATTGAPIGEPLTGHTDMVWALAAYPVAQERQLASVGADGTVLLWDAATGELLQRVFVAPIQLRGLADRRAVRDLLGRQMLTQELAGLLNWHADEADAEPGPTVVTVEGPWGAGKTSIMGLVRDQIAYRPPEPTHSRPLSVRAARKLLRQGAAAGTPTTMRSWRSSCMRLQTMVPSTRT